MVLSLPLALFILLLVWNADLTDLTSVRTSIVSGFFTLRYKVNEGSGTKCTKFLESIIFRKLIEVRLRLRIMERHTLDIPPREKFL